MNENIIYTISKSHISKDKMQFEIVNRHPKHISNEHASMQAKIEEELFIIFRKYT